MNTSDDKQSLNIAGRFAAYFIDSKLTTLIILVALLAGVIAMLVTPREENPRIVVPAADIIVSKPGASPTEVEQLIVKPLEAILQSMSGVEHTYGLARDSEGVVSVQFFVGENKEDSLIKLYDHIMGNLDRMPSGTHQPLIKSLDIDNVPILTVSFSSDNRDDRQLHAVASDVLEQLRRIDGTSVSFLHGGRKRKINVNLDLDRMHHYNVSLLDIRRVLQASNVDIPSGSLVKNNTVSTLKAGGFLRSADELRRLVVALSAHRPVYLSDVADISDGPGEIKTLHRIGYGPAFQGERGDDLEAVAVTLAIAKRAGTNAVTVADKVLGELEKLRPHYIPSDIKINVTRNDGARANDAVNTLMEHLAIAIATVVALLVAFLGWRSASIVTITIPLILFITLAVGMAAGQSINRITLFALILSLGLLVDDSIVVIENIYRHYAKKGVERMKSVVKAVNEIGRPTNLATFTVIVAFLPMLWVSGMMGPYMAPIPFNVPVAMITSLVIAYTVAPWAAYRWLKPSEAQAESHAPGRIERAYAALMTRLLQYRAARYGLIFSVVALMFVALALPALDIVQFKMLPKNNNNSFNITIDMPEGTSLEETDRSVRLAGDILRSNPHVASFESTVGQSGVVDFNGLLRGAGLKKGSHIGEIRVNLRDKHARKDSSIDIVRELRPAYVKLATDTGANIKLVEDPPGPPVRATILAELYGPADVDVNGDHSGNVEKASGQVYDHMRQIAQELRTEVFAKTTDMVDIDDSNTADTLEYRIEVLREKAALAGILPGQVAETLRTLLAGEDIGTVHIDWEKDPVPIHFRIPQASRVDSSDLRKIFITNQIGKRIPLSDISEIRAYTAPKPILHKDQRPVVYVSGELASTSQVYAIMDMWRYLRDNPLPSGVELAQFFTDAPGVAGYSLRWDGEMRLTLDVFRDLGSAFAVAIVLIYLILVGYYHSFLIPLIVMGAIPLTIIGVFPGHTLTGQYFTATSMIGVIALAGIVVRNSLLLIDFIMEFRKQGHRLEDSVLQAGVTRMRPILLTAFAIILGTFIMIFDPVFGGLAVALIFGTFASTMLTLFVIPLLYFAYARRTQ